ncbi:hypothetical protein PGT21_028950 [Puccinia graminis f. sp. tritici]|uniref:Uncharacterized protein n=1 Tax=Puccinia graminis f. sp. tritici TaxID=56615 RepID=A0A5B0NKB1_PUCGR|nr:hypothetical protein PGT21_028906 [Puccinia graminis f. sp. tritici]KAA1089755.1 hypothetical protein PGT21_028950 [Puccinia graminis f. sp. tritici]
MPVPVSIPIKTADIFDRVRLPTSSSGFDRIFRASTTNRVIFLPSAESIKVIGQDQSASGCSASRRLIGARGVLRCAVAFEAQVLVVLIPPQEVPEPVEAFRIKSHRSIECEASNKNKF